MRLCIFFFIIFGFQPMLSWSAVPETLTRSLQILQNNQSTGFRPYGVWTGGSSGRGLSLRNLAFNIRPNGREQLVFDIYNERRARSQTGQFHLSFQPNNRLVLTFYGVQNSYLAQRDLKARLLGSSTIEKMNIFHDPIDNSIMFIFSVKPKTLLSVHYQQERGRLGLNFKQARN